MNERKANALRAALHELEEAQAQHPPMHSAHEGLAVIWEEFEELKAEVWKRPGKRDLRALHAEAVQLTAMGLRFLIDVSLPALEEAWAREEA